MTAMSTSYTSDRRSIRTGCWSAALIAIVGLGIGVAYGLAGTASALSAPDRFERTSVGGSLAVEVEAPGPMVVYAEGPGVPSLSGLRLIVISPSGAHVVVDPYIGDLRYDRNGGLGTAVGIFKASETGPYQITSGAPRTGGILAVGPDIGGRLADAFVRAGLIVGLTLAAGIALAAASSVAARR
jgi:hypothetical protein